MVVWIQLKHGYESIRAGKQHLVSILNIFVWWYLVFPGNYLLTQLAYFCPSTVWFDTKFSSRKEGSPWKDKTVKERRKRKQSNWAFPCNASFPWEDKKLHFSCCRKSTSQMWSSMPVHRLTGQKMCTGGVKPQNAAAQRSWRGSFFSSTWVLQAVELMQLHWRSRWAWHP